MDKETIKTLHELELRRDKWQKFVESVKRYRNIGVENLTVTPSRFVCNICYGSDDQEDFIKKVVELATDRVNYYEEKIEKL